MDLLDNQEYDEEIRENARLKVHVKHKFYRNKKIKKLLPSLPCRVQKIKQNYLLVKANNIKLAKENAFLSQSLRSKNIENIELNKKLSEQMAENNKIRLTLLNVNRVLYSLQENNDDIKDTNLLNGNNDKENTNILSTQETNINKKYSLARREKNWSNDLRRLSTIIEQAVSEINSSSMSQEITEKSQDNLNESTNTLVNGSIEEQRFNIDEILSNQNYSTNGPVNITLNNSNLFDISQYAMTPEHENKSIPTPSIFNLDFSRYLLDQNAFNDSPLIMRSNNQANLIEKSPQFAQSPHIISSTPLLHKQNVTFRKKFSRIYPDSNLFSNTAQMGRESLISLNNFGLTNTTNMNEETYDETITNTKRRGRKGKEEKKRKPRKKVKSDNESTNQTNNTTLDQSKNTSYNLRTRKPKNYKE